MLTTTCAIIGGGITGLAAAIKLADAGVGAVVLERGNLWQQKAGESLSPRASRYLRQLHINIEQKPYCAEYYGSEIKWGGIGVHTQNYITSPNGMPFTVDRKALENDLAEICKTKGASVLPEIKLTGVKFTGNGWQLQGMQKGQPINVFARLLIIATGRQFYKLVAENRKIYTDKLLAYSTILPTTTPAVRQLNIAAFENGWAYSNSLPSGSRVLSVFSDSDTFSRHMLTAAFLKQFTGGYTIDTNNWLALDARTYNTVIQAGKGWLTLGDACYAIDPLSGMGIDKNFDMIDFFMQQLNGFIDYDLNTSKQFLLYNKTNFAEYENRRLNEYRKVTKYNTVFWQRRMLVA